MLGRVVRVNDEPSTIVGVMPEGMRFPLNPDTWRPLQPTDALDRRDNRTLSTVGRLAPGVDLDAADAEVRAPAPTVTMLSVGARYFESLRVSLTRGRALTLEDGREGAESVVVNGRLAARFFPGDDSLGRRIRLRAQGRPPGPWLTIAGVSPSVRQLALQERNPDPVVYLPYRLYTVGPAALQSSLAIQLLPAGNPAGFVPQLREAVQAVDPELPVFGARSMSARLRDSRWTYLLFSGLFGIFAAIALVLSAVGIYAVTAYSTDRLPDGSSSRR